ncbi:MAG: hypothetical protein K2K33_05710 [Muribaculaceae bacterium]|nr:hypothetical protein [Muribaculaceae bacterium]
MNNIGHEEARYLMNKFLDGATSNVEEARLHGYFMSGHVADDMAPYAEMMGWFADLDESGARVDAPRHMSLRQRAVSRRRWITGAAAAAVIGLAVTVGVVRPGQGGGYDQDLLEMYEGSYMVRDGKKLTDLNKVIPNILEIERCAAKMRNEARSEFTSIHDEMYDELYEACDSIINCMAAEIGQEEF